MVCSLSPTLNVPFFITQSCPTIRQKELLRVSPYYVCECLLALEIYAQAVIMMPSFFFLREHSMFSDSIKSIPASSPPPHIGPKKEENFFEWECYIL